MPPENARKNQRFSDVFRGYRNVALDKNGLIVIEVSANARVFYEQHFYKKRLAKIGKKSSKNQATPWGWAFVIWKLFDFLKDILKDLEKKF